MLPIPMLGVTYSGFVNGETSSVLGGTLSVVDSDAAATTAVGSYAGVITASGQTSTNYTITYVAGNLTVTPAPLTITADSVTKTYGQAETLAGTDFSDERAGQQRHGVQREPEQHGLQRATRRNSRISVRDCRVGGARLWTWRTTRSPTSTAA